MFRFRLQPLLNFRKRQEEEKQRELAVVNRELVGAQDNLEKFYAQRKQAVEKLDEISSGVKDINVLKLYEDFITGKDLDITGNKSTQQEINGRLAEKQAQLLEYVKRRRIIELFRDRQKEAYMADERKKERITTDEISAQMFLREAAL